MTAIVATMASPSQPHHPSFDPEQDSPGTSGFNTHISTPSGQHTPAAGYRTAAGTLSNVFASLWGTYNHQEQQQHDSGPSRLHSPFSSSQTTAESPNPSIPGGWGNLLSWGPAAGRQNTSSTIRKSASPSRAPKPSRARGAIPFNISAPLEAAAENKVEKIEGRDKKTQGTLSVQPQVLLQRRSETVVSPRLSPTGSPRRRPLAGIFEDLDSLPQTPASRSPASPRGQFRDLPPASPSLTDESPSGAYATLSRLQSKPSTSKLRSGSGFLWPAASDHSTSPSAAATQSRPAAGWSEALARAEKLDSYVRRIVFQAGLDYETRPMVVLAACSLPDPKQVDYDALLDRIMDIMDLFVENDYTVIYFAGGGHHRPGWNWIWRAYRRLDRRFRKNLKKIYIIHPTFFTRSLLQFVNTGAYFVSPKFNKKVSQLYTLSALAEHVPLTQIDIPPEVLQWNTRYEKNLTLPPSRNSTDGGSAVGTGEKVFGVDLVTLMGEYGESGGVPRVVRDCVEAILGDFDGIRPAQVEGIFRRSPSSALLRTAQESYDRGHPVSLEQYRDPHIPAVLLKVFIRSLRRPIFPASMYGMIRACPYPPLSGSDDAGQAQETIEYLRTRLLPAIEPASAGLLLSYVLEMLHKVALYKETNKMDAANLATVIAPNLVASGNAIKDVMICRVDGISSMSTSPQTTAIPTMTTTTTTMTTPNLPRMRKASISNSIEAQSHHNTTLGSILRFCIERYYEIFDEVSFTAPVNTVQGLVDGLVRDATSLGGGGGASPSVSVKSRRLPSGIYDTPPASSGLNGGFQRQQQQLGHRRDESGRLGGSNNNLRASFTPLTPPVTAATTSAGVMRGISGLGVSTTPTLTSASESSGGVEADTERLVSQLSGVVINGENATATFTSCGGTDALPSSSSSLATSVVVKERDAISESSAKAVGTESAIVFGGAISGDSNERPPSSPKGSSSGDGGGVESVRGKCVRRELSEVVEAEDD
uniref:Related to Rho-GTPase-activating protein 1 n=1 Tax=Melanopsichium pennsylvanicum 4 TaxID=1398559 RepID=A0A077R7Y5_9BASI|nr:related to Rho-GTPase-activating protein 1 [Melanopsichium pennsylvanicum 4]